MALPRETYEKARQEALLHLQVKILPFKTEIKPDCFYAAFPIEGKIVRVFRGHKICKIGQILDFNIAVKSSSEIMLGGRLFLNAKQLKTYQYMEVYLNGKPPQCEVALSQNILLKEPTNEPVIFCQPISWRISKMWTIIQENFMRIFSYIELR